LNRGTTASRIAERSILLRWNKGLYRANEFQKAYVEKSVIRRLPLRLKELSGFVVVGADPKQSMVEWRKHNLRGETRRIEKHIVWCEEFDDALMTFLRFS
jgi:hypothetical protein